jgi:hypothetical protein
MDFQPCLADPDVWFHPATKPDGFEYYEYLIVYVDDILVLSHRSEDIMRTLEKGYHLKDAASMTYWVILS